MYLCKPFTSIHATPASTPASPPPLVTPAVSAEPTPEHLISNLIESYLIGFKSLLNLKLFINVHHGGVTRRDHRHSLPPLRTLRDARRHNLLMIMT